MIPANNKRTGRIGIERLKSGDVRISTVGLPAGTDRCTWSLPHEAAGALVSWWARARSAGPERMPVCERIGPFEFVMHTGRTVGVALLDERGHTVTTGWRLPREVVDELAGQIQR